MRTDIGDSDRADAVAIQEDGKIVAAGSGVVDDLDFALARYLLDGSLDLVFDGDGRDHGGDEAVAIQANGRIVAAGSSLPVPDLDFALHRYFG